MVRIPRKIYTCEFKMEAVRLVESSQSVASAARAGGCHRSGVPEDRSTSSGWCSLALGNR